MDPTDACLKVVGEAGAETLHWTVVLDDPEEIEAVRERVRAAGIAVEDKGEGFLVRDPWDIATVFTLN